MLPLALVAWLLIGACAPWVAPVPPLPPPPPRPALPPAAPTGLPLEPASCDRILGIEVRKSARVLRARCEGGAEVGLPVALGREPEGPKLRAGDYRTPEGEYRVAGPARSSRFHLFIPIDYPSVADALRARERGLLSSETVREIVGAREAGRLPPQDSPLGGSLGLHGEGERWRGESLHLDWTHGCVALSDRHIEFLAERVEVGTPVLVLP
jgi:murein L,D-transpeptidase YafK